MPNGAAMLKCSHGGKQIGRHSGRQRKCSLNQVAYLASSENPTKKMLEVVMHPGGRHVRSGGAAMPFVLEGGSVLPSVASVRRARGGSERAVVECNECNEHGNYLTSRARHLHCG